VFLFKHLAGVKGGISAWSDEIDPTKYLWQEQCPVGLCQFRLSGTGRTPLFRLVSQW
jgi:hypothetical protein